MSKIPVSLSTLQSLFGPCVFLKWPSGMKGDERRWKHITQADMTDVYLSDILEGNIGIALGRVSGGLCAIDLDRDDLVQAFCDANPWTAYTVITRGARGCQIWVRIIGGYPPTCALKYEDKKCGEWRADGGQSIIPPSIHPNTGQPYEFLSSHPVASLGYNLIQYPEGFSGASHEVSLSTQTPNPTQHTTQSTQLCPHNTSMATVNKGCQPGLSSPTAGDDCQPDYAALVAPHVATEKGHNNAKLFQLAQAVKLAETLGNTIDAEKVFDLWWAQSEPFTKRTLNADTYRCEFRRALGCVKGDPVMVAWGKSADLAAP